MIVRKTGYPQEDELVMCTVTKVHPHGVFARLDEYQNQSGMIHISEVSPGRIRNIRDYVVEGKVVICKVLRINKERGHIDLSLRRVSEGQKRNKADELKQERIAEKIIEYVGKKLKVDQRTLIEKVIKKITEKYETLYACFEDIISGEAKLEDVGVEKNIAKELTNEITTRIKPIVVEMSGELTLTSYAPDGVNVIKKAVEKAEKVSEEASIRYIGAGKYGITVKAGDYKSGEALLKKVAEAALKTIEKTPESTGEFVKIDKK